MSKTQTTIAVVVHTIVFTLYPFSFSLAQTPIYFEDSAVAILRKNCTACHNAKLAEGGLNLETHADLLKGGDSGPAIDLANVDSSHLLQRPVADADSLMPPDGNKVGAERLTSEQLATLKSWVAGGALTRGTSQNAMDYSNLHLPESARASYAVAISPDSDFVAFGRGGQLVIYDAKRLASAQPIADKIDAAPTQVILNAHPDFIHSIAISPDGKRIATGSTGQVKVWKRTEPALDAARTELASAGIDLSKMLSMSTDGSKFAILESTTVATSQPDASETTNKPSSKLKLIARDGKVLHTIAVPGESLVVGTWSPSNNRFFAIGASKQLHIWDITIESATLSTTELATPIQSMVALDESTLLVTNERKAIVLQAKSPSGELVPDHPLAAAINAAGPVDRISLSADRTLACSVTQDEATGLSTLKLWNVAQAKLSGAFERDRIEQVALLNSDRELRRTQASVDRSKALVAEQEKALEAEQAAVKAAEASLEKATQAAMAKEKEMQTATAGIAEHEKAMADTKTALDAATQKLAQLTTELEPKKKALGELEKQNTDAKGNVTNSTQALVGIQENQKTAVVRLEERKKRVEKENETLTTVQAKNASAKSQNESVRFSVQSVAFTGKDRLAATRVAEKALTNVLDFFSTETMERIESRTLTQPIANGPELAAIAHEDRVAWQQESVWSSPSIVVDRATALAFSQDGKTLAIGSGLASRSGQLSIVRVADGNPIKTLPDLHSDTLLGLAYSPDGRWLASCGADKMTKLLNAQTYEIAKMFEGHTHHVLALAWQEDANRLATASSDATVKLWDIEKGESIRTVTGFGNEVTSIAFVGSTPNTVSASMNNLVRLHDSNSGKQNKQYGPTGDSLFCVVTSPNGKYAIATGQEGIARIWNIEDGKLVGQWQ